MSDDRMNRWNRIHQALDAARKNLLMVETTALPSSLSRPDRIRVKSCLAVAAELTRQTEAIINVTRGLLGDGDETDLHDAARLMEQASAVGELGDDGRGRDMIPAPGTPGSIAVRPVAAASGAIVGRFTH